MVNLMDPSADNTAPENLIVDVKDHDINVPADIGGGSDSKNMKIWLYVLGGAVLIFIVVFALLSRQTSLFQGYTRIESTADSTLDEDASFDDFNTSAAGEEFVGVGEEVVGEGDFASEPGEGGSVDIDDFTSGVFTDGDSEPALDDSLFGDETDDVVVADGSEPLVVDEPVVDDVFAPSDPFNDLFAPDSSFPAADDSFTSEIVATQDDGFSGPSLDSNTDANIMQSPDVQGDTGPAVGLALIPSIAYALARRRREV